MNETSRAGVRPFRFVLVGALLALLMPSLAAALALGNISVKSSLNQPFAAQIELSGAKTYAVDKVVAKLASKQAFSRANIGYSPLFAGLNFAVKQRVDGSAYVKVWSATPVSEPILHFLIEVRTPHGRLYRDYTLFLDPPTSNQPVLAAVQTPSVPAAATTSSVFVTPNGTSNPVGAEPLPLPVVGEVFDFQAYDPRTDRSVSAAPRRPAAARASTYKVRAGDSLSKIAAKFTSIAKRNQMTVALYNANPDAFLGNVNGLKRGVVLKVPTAAEMNAISPKAAQTELRRQAEAWAANNGQPVTASQRDPEAQVINDSRNNNADGLVIVAPSTSDNGAYTLVDSQGNSQENAADSDDTAQTYTGDAAVLSSIEQRAQAAEDQVATLQQENQSLQATLDTNQQQLVEMRQALQLRSEQINALQQRLLALETRQDQGRESGSAASGSATADTNTRLQPGQKPVAEGDGMAWWLLIVIGLLLLVLILFVLRRRSDDEDEEDHPFYKDPVAPTPLVSNAADAHVLPDNSVVVEESDLDETLRADAEQEIDDVVEDAAPVVDGDEEPPLAFSHTDIDVAEDDIEPEPVAKPADFSSLKLEDEEPQVVSDFSGGDEMNTKLDLARAYIDMDNGDEAAELLKNVAAEGDEAQREEAQSLLDRLS